MSGMVERVALAIHGSVGTITGDEEDMAGLVRSIGGGEGLSEEEWADFREKVAKLVSDANAERERLKR